MRKKIIGILPLLLFFNLLLAESSEYAICVPGASNGDPVKSTPFIKKYAELINKYVLPVFPCKSEKEINLYTINILWGNFTGNITLYKKNGDNWHIAVQASIFFQDIQKTKDKVIIKDFDAVLSEDEKQKFISYFTTILLSKSNKKDEGEIPVSKPSVSYVVEGMVNKEYHYAIYKECGFAPCILSKLRKTCNKEEGSLSLDNIHSIIGIIEKIYDESMSGKRKIVYIGERENP
jgi:hypothetical protein